MSTNRSGILRQGAKQTSANLENLDCRDTYGDKLRKRKDNSTNIPDDEFNYPGVLQEWVGLA